MKSTAQKWVDQARYDVETARAMLATGRYLYVMFCCQQAIEKALKALIVEHSNEPPPRIHSLPRLAEIRKLELTEERLTFLAGLSAFYIQTRYPEEIDTLGAMINRDRAGSTLDRTEELLTWLFSMLR